MQQAGNGISRIEGSETAKRFLYHKSVTQKCQVFSFTVPEKPKSWTELELKRGTLSDFSFLSQNIK